MTLRQLIVFGGSLLAFVPCLPAQSLIDSRAMAEVEHDYAMRFGASQDTYGDLIRSQVQAFEHDESEDRSTGQDAKCPLWLLHSTVAMATSNEAVHALQSACTSGGITVPAIRKDISGPYAYNPVLLSLIAGLETRSYSRGKDVEWQEIKLTFPAGQSDAYFQKPVEAHFRQGSPGGDRLFILMNSSYSTWTRGTWTNKTTLALRTAFPTCHILVVAGFLTPGVLASQPQVPDLTGERTARDLYLRIEAFIAHQQQEGALPANLQTGLVGFSGGANVVMSLLQQDALQKTPSHAPIFPLGGIAFSPIVDLAGTFTVLDGSSNAILKSGFPKNDGLTTASNMLGLAFKGYLPGHVSKFLDLLTTRPDVQATARNFENRFYREFELVDLQSVIKAPYAAAPPCQTTSSFTGYYVGCLFPWYAQRFPDAKDQPFEQYTDVARLTAKIEAPVYVVFAMDDPVLSQSAVDPAVKGQRVEESLRALRLHPGFRVFTPSKGGHLGYMLDSMFLIRSLNTFFSRPSA